MYTAAVASVKQTKTCPETCPRRARTSPKPPYASQREKKNPSASRRLTEGRDSTARIVRAALSQLSYPPVRRPALLSPQLERREPRRRRHAVRVPAAERVVLVEHRAELIGRTVHAGRRALGDGLVHDLPREHVVAAPHALARVEQPLEVDDALPHALELLDGHVPAGDGEDHPRVGLLEEESETALGGEAAQDERVADGREVLAPHGERGLVLGGPTIEPLRVLGSRTRVVVAPAAGRRGVADREPLERARRGCRQLEALHRIDELRRLGVDRLGEAPGALGEAGAEGLAARRHLHEPEHPAPVPPPEVHADVTLREPAALERLADEGGGGAPRDRGHAEEGAGVGGEEQRLGVRDAEHRAQREDRLVLGHLRPRARELALADRVLLAARHRTLEARRVPVVVVGLHLLAADATRLGE